MKVMLFSDLAITTFTFFTVSSSDIKTSRSALASLDVGIDSWPPDRDGARLRYVRGVVADGRPEESRTWDGLIFFDGGDSMVA